LWNSYRGVSSGNRSQSIDILFDISRASDKTNNRTIRDSALNLAMETALMSGSEELMMTFYISFFSLDSATYGKDAEDYAKQMLVIARNHNNDNWLYEAYSAIAASNVAKTQYDQALENSGKAYYYANQTGNYSYEVKSMLLYGSCLELNNRKTEAFRNYMDALFRAERRKNDSLISKCYESLASFYVLINKYEKAKYYKINQINIITSQEQFDSVAVMNGNIELATILFSNKENPYAEKLLQRVLDYARRHNNDGLRKNAFSIYRFGLISAGQFNRLADLYTNRYPDELKRTAVEDTTLFYRLSAFMDEARGSMDSAAIFYNLAEERLLKEEKGKYALSTFYKRYGQFLLRRQQLPEAESKLQKAYLYAEQVNYLPFMIEDAQLLDSVNVLLGRMDSAHYYSQLKYDLTQKLSSITREGELLRLEIDNETKKLELERQREEEQIRRRHNLQYMGITMGITTSFIILAMLGSFKVHRYVIKGMGFFSFIFLFEFIILLADHQIHHATHGEPWKIMAIKIVLIGILLPLHHYVEEKVVHYLTNHRLVDTSKFSFRWFKKKPTELPKPISKEELINEN
jgi:hypothetical protein